MLVNCRISVRKRGTYQRPLRLQGQEVKWTGIRDVEGGIPVLLKLHGDKHVIYAFYIETNVKHRLEFILRT